MAHWAVRFLVFGYKVFGLWLSCMVLGMLPLQIKTTERIWWALMPSPFPKYGFFWQQLFLGPGSLGFWVVWPLKSSGVRQAHSEPAGENICVEIFGVWNQRCPSWGLFLVSFEVRLEWTKKHCRSCVLHPTSLFLWVG